MEAAEAVCYHSEVVQNISVGMAAAKTLVRTSNPDPMCLPPLCRSLRAHTLTCAALHLLNTLPTQSCAVALHCPACLQTPSGAGSTASDLPLQRHSSSSATRSSWLCHRCAA